MGLAARLGLLPRQLALLLLTAPLTAWLAGTGEVLRASPANFSFDRLNDGTFAGWPFVAFVRVGLPLLLGALALGLWAGRGPDRRVGPWTVGPLARVLLPQVPWGLLVWLGTSEDLARRPALEALLLAGGVVLAILLGPPARAPLFDPPKRSWLREHAPVLLVIAAHFALFSFLTIRRDRALWSATVDLGLFKESLWHTLHGRVLHSPTVGYSFLGEHFSPVLFLLVPFYALSPSSETLLLAQTGAISIAAWPLYRLARLEGLSRALATVVAASLLASPAMQGPLMYDFHMDLLGVPALTACILFAREKRWRAMALAAALLCSVKEEAFVGLTGVGASIVVTERGKDRRAGVWLIAGALLWCGLAIAVFIRRFGPPPGVPVYMSSGADEGYKFLRNFRHFGGRVPGILRPLRFVVWAFSEARLSTLLTLSAPLLLCAALARRHLVLLTPLAVMLLSDNPEITALAYHYAAMQHPALWCAGVYGMATLFAWFPDARPTLDRALAAGVAVSTLVLLGTHPLSLASGLSRHDQRHVTPHVARVDEMLRQIPAEAAVSATSFGGPRLSNRPSISLFPRDLERVDAIYVDTQRPAWPATADGRDSAVLSLLRSGTWGVVGWGSGALVARRGASPEQNRRAVRELFLHREWEVEGTEQTDFPSCVEADPEAGDGYARVVRPTDRRPAGFVHFGPYVHLPAGRYRAVFRLRAVPTAFGGTIGRVDVFDGGRTLGAHDLTPEDFPDAQWQSIGVEFSSQGEHGLEFRIRTDKNWVLGADRISVEPLDDEVVLLRHLGF